MRVGERTSHGSAHLRFFACAVASKEALRRLRDFLSHYISRSIAPEACVLWDFPCPVGEPNILSVPRKFWYVPFRCPTRGSWITPPLASLIISYFFLWRT